MIFYRESSTTGKKEFRSIDIVVSFTIRELWGSPLKYLPVSAKHPFPTVNQSSITLKRAKDFNV